MKPLIEAIKQVHATPFKEGMTGKWTKDRYSNLGPFSIARLAVFLHENPELPISDKPVVFVAKDLSTMIVG